MYVLFTYIGLISMVNLGKYTRPIESLGSIFLMVLQRIRCSPNALVSQPTNLFPKGGYQALGCPRKGLGSKVRISGFFHPNMSHL